MDTATPHGEVTESHPPSSEECRRNPPFPRRSRTLTVLLIDPRQLTRESLARWLQASARDFRIVPLSDTAELARTVSAAGGGGGKPDLILLNIAGAEVTEPRVAQAIEALDRGLPDVPLVVLADREDTDAVAEAIRRGARGYIPTALHAGLVIGALRLVAAGGTFVPPDALVRSLMQRRPTNGRGTPEDVTGRRSAAPDGFTAREGEVLALLRQGKSNKVIAFELAMRESTAKVHVRRIMKKLNATNRTQAAFLASRMSAG